MLRVSPRKLRVHSLTGRITPEVMRKAFTMVKRNRGAAGLDQESIKMVEANLEENLLALMRDVKSGTYQAIPLRRVYIPKSKGAWLPARDSRRAVSGGTGGHPCSDCTDFRTDLS